jgi:hypothetical protein
MFSKPELEAGGGRAIYFGNPLVLLNSYFISSLYFFGDLKWLASDRNGWGMPGGSASGV